MSESDITKMKVADLKRELKTRGLPTTGNKTDLQDRLQTALLGGDTSSLDTSILSGEDLLDAELNKSDDVLLSPISGDSNGFPKPDDAETKPAESTVKAPRKVILKRKTSITPIISQVRDSTTEANGSDDKLTTEVQKPKQIIKFSDHTLEDRLQMRAKKFGVSTNPSTTVNSSNSLSAQLDPKQIEILKKRAQRFGCNVSSTIAKLDAHERLEQRKKRFGDLSTATKNIDGAKALNYAEKARLRLERFKTTPK